MTLTDIIYGTKVAVIDGAMGTQLSTFGIEMGGQNNVSNPDKVLAVHNRYLNAGADILITNTLTMNRIYIENHNVNVDVRDVNLAGAKIAKSAVNENQFVVGDISSTGAMLQPYGLYTEEQFIDNYKEQAEILAEGGVDGFIIETMMDLNETLCALKACKAVSKLPVITSITYSTLANGGRTIMGNSAEECAKQLADNGADVIGSNCGDLDPFEMAEIVATYKKHSSLPVLAMPNAGKPVLVNGETLFNMEPPQFVDGVKKCIEAGAIIVGGCCGTSPDYIQALTSR